MNEDSGGSCLGLILVILLSLLAWYCLLSPAY